MKEDFDVQISIRKGLCSDVKGNRYIIQETVKNLENLEDYVVLQSIESGKTFVCPSSYFLSPRLNEDESLTTRFKIERIFE